MVRPLVPDDELAARVRAALKDSIDKWTPAGQGGFSSAGLWVVETGAGRSWFVKAASNDRTAEFLRDEMVLFDGITADYMPEVIGWDDDGVLPFVVMEDLSARRWPPPWSDDDVAAALDVCDEIAGTTPPPGLPPDRGRPFEMGWALIGEDPDSLADVLSRDWLEKSLPVLADADESAEFGGSRLVHLDLRSDNMCFGPGVKVVDWNWAQVGNPALDVVGLLPSLYLEGGPAPWSLLRGQPELVAAVAGFFLHHSRSPAPPDVRPDIRDFQRAQGMVALEWACIELQIARPDPVIPG